MKDIVSTERPAHRDVPQVIDSVPILDTSRFEHMQRIANVMASTSLIPESLRTSGKRDSKIDLPFAQVFANCFLIVNQATRWGMDPFAVASCCSVVHGRLQYEGKLVSAVLEAKLGSQLFHYFTGNPGTDDYRIFLSDKPFTSELIASLKPGASLPGFNLWDGSVAEWKTTGDGSPWSPKNYRRMLIYRGTRDWARIYRPALMLGVYTDDELLDLADDARARRATPVTSLIDRLSGAANSQTSGFSLSHVESETRGAINGGASQSNDEIQDNVNPNAHHDDSSLHHEAAPAPSDPASTTGGAGDNFPGDAAALPDNWQVEYVGVLRRARQQDSLKKFSAQFWDQYGGREKYAKTDDGKEAAAIFMAFEMGFGDRAAIDAQLREIGVL